MIMKAHYQGRAKGVPSLNSHRVHPRITELLAHLDRERAGLHAAVESVSPARREERQAPERWSVAEILEHLVLVERRLTYLVATAVAGARAKGLPAETEMTPVMWTVPVKVFLDRSRKITAAEAVLPRGELDSAAASKALESTRAQLRATIIAADGLALADVVYPHPLVGQLNMYQWIGFIGSHEARHAAQIRDLAAEGAVSQRSPATAD